MSKSLCHKLVLASAVAVATAAFATMGSAAPPPASVLATQSPPPPPAPPQALPQARPRSILDQLGLSDAQRTRIHELQQASAAKEQPFMQVLRERQDAFAAEIPGSPNYQSAANALATAEANAARAHVLTEAAYRADVYHLLTTEQRTTLARFTAQQKARLDQWRKEQAQRAAAARAAAARAPAASGS